MGTVLHGSTSLLRNLDMLNTVSGADHWGRSGYSAKNVSCLSQMPAQGASLFTLSAMTDLLDKTI